MNNSNKIEKPTNEEQEKLIQSQFNINVAFYVHLKAYNNSVREELERRLSEVFFFSKGIDWKFDSFGIEKTGSRGCEVLGYFIFRAVELEKLQKIIEDETKINLTKNKERIQSAITLHKIEDIFSSLSSLENMKHVAILSPANLSLIEQVYNIKCLWIEKAIISEDDIIFNYHLQKVLKELLFFKEEDANHNSQITVQN